MLKVLMWLLAPCEWDRFSQQQLFTLSTQHLSPTLIWHDSNPEDRPPPRSPLTLAGCWAPSSGRTGAVRRRWRCAAGRCRVLPAGSAADLLRARASRLLKRRRAAALTRCRCRRGSSWRRRPAGRWRPSARSWRFQWLFGWFDSESERTPGFKRLLSCPHAHMRAHITHRCNVVTASGVTSPNHMHSPPLYTVRNGPKGSGMRERTRTLSIGGKYGISKQTETWGSWMHVWAASVRLPPPSAVKTATDLLELDFCFLKNNLQRTVCFLPCDTASLSLSHPPTPTPPSHEAVLVWVRWNTHYLQHPHGVHGTCRNTINGSAWDRWQG